MARLWCRETLWMAVLAMVMCAAAQADTHYVDQKSPKPEKPYLTEGTAAHDIQSAVDEAEKDDTVAVSAGTYPVAATLNVAKAVTVQGAGADKTTIDAGGKCRAVTLGGGATFKGFTVTGGKAREGGGVACGAGVTLVADCTISNNTAERFGGGISARPGGGPCVIRDCRIVGNKVTQAMHTDTPWGGGGLYVNPNTSVRNCWIEGNEAAQRGGGIYAHEFLVVENCSSARTYSG